MGPVQIRLPNQIELHVGVGADPAWLGNAAAGAVHMFSLSEQIQVFLKPEVTDGRLGVNALGLVGQMDGCH
jgi:hypothetical protein